MSKPPRPNPPAAANHATSHAQASPPATGVGAGDTGSIRLEAARLLASGVLAVALPLVLQALPFAWVRSTYGGQYQIFELFGLCGFLFVAYNGAVDARRLRGRGAIELVPVLLFAAVALHWLFIISEYSWKAADFESYEVGAKALLAGASPYPGRYIYPPLLAQLLGWTVVAVSRLGASLGTAVSAESAWSLVFYFYQCAQYFAILLAYRLSQRFARRLGFSVLAASGLVATLFVLDNPLLRTVRHNQVNVFVLITVLGGILWLERRPWASGLLVAAGGHLKLLPFALALPWVLTRKWRAVVAVAVGTIGIAALELLAGLPQDVWTAFLDYLPNAERGLALRNNSLHSLLANVISAAGMVSPAETVEATAARLRDAAAPAVLVVTLLVLAWFGVRIRSHLRERRSRLTSLSADAYLSGALAMEMVGVMLLLSPSVWEHHFVLAIPLTLWVTALRGKDRPLAVFVAAVLVFCVPTFDLFPLSYHRMTGLVMLLLLASPANSGEDSRPQAPGAVSRAQAPERRSA